MEIWRKKSSSSSQLCALYCMFRRCIFLVSFSVAPYIVVSFALFGCYCFRRKLMSCLNYQRSCRCVRVRGRRAGDRNVSSRLLKYSRSIDETASNPAMSLLVSAVSRIPTSRTFAHLAEYELFH